MRGIRAIGIAFTALAAVSFCAAQGVEIKGVVKDGAGIAISGAVIKSQKTAYQATSGADGSFTLNAASSGLKGLDRRARSQRLSASVENGSLWIQVPEKGDVSVTAFGMDGKALSSVQMEMEAGFHSVALPDRGQGLVFYRVGSNGKDVMTKSMILSESDSRAVLSSPFKAASTASAASAPIAKQAAAAASYKDILVATKDGFLNYRMTLTSQIATGLEIRMVAGAGTLKDADGNEYQTVKLGNQVWMAEHLRTTKFNDGTAIPLASAQSAWANRATPAYCYYNNMTDADSIKNFGALYNWHAVNTLKLAPAGWHVPSETDWMALQNYLISAGFNFDGSTSGNKIGKSMAARTDWTSSANAGAVGNDPSKNNRSGFSAVPTGFRDQGGGFTSMGSRCIMHSANNKENTFGYFADIDGASADLRYSDDWMSMGFLVRLVKN